MRCVSLWQPWGSLWLSPRKKHETRHWETSFRGWLAVHAAQRFERNFDRDDRLSLILASEFGIHWRSALPTGVLLGAVKLIGCHRTEDVQPTPDDLECGDFGEGRFAWERGEFVLLPTPIPWRGFQGFFSVPDDLFTDLVGAPPIPPQLNLFDVGSALA